MDRPRPHGGGGARLGCWSIDDRLADGWRERQLLPLVGVDARCSDGRIVCEPVRMAGGDRAGAVWAPDIELADEFLEMYMFSLHNFRMLASSTCLL